MTRSWYQDHDTWLHSLDPRTKIIGALMIFLFCLCVNHPLPMAAIAGAVFAMIGWGRSLGALWALRYVMVLLILFSMTLWPFFVKGPTILYSCRFMEISRESLLYGTAMGLRLAAFVMGGLLLLATTRIEDINSGLIRLGLPYPAAFALTTALRLVPAFTGAGATIIQAQISRGLDLESRRIPSRIRSLLPLAIPMFVSAIRYTNLLAMALESRGFRPGAPRTLFHDSRMAGKDWWTLAVLTLILIAFLYLRLAMHVGAVFPGRI
jgi:energy-coupling factor transport system permease protein